MSAVGLRPADTRVGESVPNSLRPPPGYEPAPTMRQLVAMLVAEERRRVERVGVNGRPLANAVYPIDPVVATRRANRAMARLLAERSREAAMARLLAERSREAASTANKTASHPAAASDGKGAGARREIL